MAYEGGCYCGALRYKVDGEPMFKGQCHCRECQYISGGHPNVIMGVPLPQFSYTKGTPAEFKRSDLDNPVTREFCGECGTHICAKPPGMPAAMLKVGTLDDPAAFGTPEMAIFTVDKQAFHHVIEGIPTFERSPN